MKFGRNFKKDFGCCIVCKILSKLLADKIADSLMLCLLICKYCIFKEIGREGPIFTDAVTNGLAGQLDR